MTHTQRVEISTEALGSIEVQVESSSAKPDSSKPTLLLLHSFSTTTKLYTAQFDDVTLSSTFNLVALDEYGHGSTTGVSESVTFWQQAELALAVLEQLRIERCFVLGTSQGGFIAARMALLKPQVVQGIVLAGSSLFGETNRKGSWTIGAILEQWLPPVTSDLETPDFVLPEPMSQGVVVSGLGNTATPETHKKWREIHEEVYKGDEGRRKFKMITRSLADRDNLSDEQLSSIKCPVLALHGTEDQVYSVPLMEEWFDKLTGSSHKKKVVVEKGSHFLAASHPEETNKELIEWHKEL